MKLNCRQGDVAVIVRSDAGNEGKIVTCIKYLGLRPWGRMNVELLPTWRIDRELPPFEGEDDEIEDRKLRPLRDSDGEDEVLRLVGLPTGTPQAA